MEVLPRVPDRKSQGVMSAADGLPRKEEDAGATPATLTISSVAGETVNRSLFTRLTFRKAGRYKLAAPVSKTGSAQTGGRSITDAFRQQLTNGGSMDHGHFGFIQAVFHLVLLIVVHSQGSRKTTFAPRGRKTNLSSKRKDIP